MQDINRVTCDGSVCPRPLELVHGRSVTIGVTGRGLDALASGMVIDKSGRRIEGVAVELGARTRVVDRSGTVTREATVTAQSVEPLADLQLLFTTRRVRGVAGRPTTRITAPLDLSIVAGGQKVERTDDQLEIRQLETRPLELGEPVLGPSVSSASPHNVTVRAGGSAQRVILRGSLLNYVMAAFVEINGTRVPDVRAELGD